MTLQESVEEGEALKVGEKIAHHHFFSPLHAPGWHRRGGGGVGGVFIGIINQGDKGRAAQCRLQG